MLKRNNFYIKQRRQRVKYSFLIFIKYYMCKLAVILFKWTYYEHFVSQAQLWFNKILPQYDEIKCRSSHALFLAIWKWLCEVYLIKVTWNLKFESFNFNLEVSNLQSKDISYMQQQLMTDLLTNVYCLPTTISISKIFNSESTTLRN